MWLAIPFCLSIPQSQIWCQPKGRIREMGRASRRKRRVCYNWASGSERVCRKFSVIYIATDLPQCACARYGQPTGGVAPTRTAQLLVLLIKRKQGGKCDSEVHIISVWLKSISYIVYTVSDPYCMCNQKKGSYIFAFHCKVSKGIKNAGEIYHRCLQN